MKQRMNFGWWKSALIICAILLCIAVTILDIVMLADVIVIDARSVPVAGVSLAAALIIIFSGLMLLFNSFYRFDEEEFIIVLGFFCDRLKYDNIEGIKQNSKNGLVTIIYNSVNEADGIQSIKLNLNDIQSEKVLSGFRKKCPFVIVETYTPEDKKKPKK